MKKYFLMSALIWGVASLFAQPGPCWQNGLVQNAGPRGGWMHLPDLTEAQQSAILEINQNFQKEALQLRNKIGEEEAKLRTLTMEAEPNLKKIERTIADMGALRTELLQKRVASDMKIRSLLTEPQKRAFDQRLSEKARDKGTPPYGPSRRPRRGRL